MSDYLSQDSSENGSMDEQQQFTDSTPKVSKLLKEKKSGEASKKKLRERMAAGTSNANSCNESMTPERRGHGKSADRQKRVDTVEREKGGFFKKLFRGSKRNKYTETIEDLGLEAGEANMTPRSDELVANPDHSLAAADKRLHELSSSKCTSSEPMTEPSVEDTTAPLEVDTSQKEQQQKQTLLPGASSDEKELHFGLGLDTVTSGLTNDIEPERRDIFFAHDEVSTLTAPSVHSRGHRSGDPIETAIPTHGLSSEPVGRYWSESKNKAAKAETISPKIVSPTIDPFAEPFFNEPDGESPIASKNVENKTTTERKLQLHLAQTQDPAGEAPFTNHSTGTTHTNEPSPRGWESPVTKFKDPLGSTISESASKRSTSGFGRRQTQPPKIPPPQRSLPHELGREPSAFRDGSPYALDPPLLLHEDTHSSSLGVVLSKGAKENSERVAVEPPTPTLTDKADSFQPPTPTARSIRSDPVEKTKYDSEPNSNDSEKEKDELPDHIDIMMEVEQRKPAVLRKAKDSVSSAENEENAGLGEARFSDELFEEKSNSTKNIYPLVKPISIHRAEKQRLKTDDEISSTRQSPEVQMVEAHPTQKLSGSPRSNSGAPCLQKTLPGSTEMPTLPVSPSIRKSKKRGSHSEEEKKEQENNSNGKSSAKPSSVVEEPAVKSVLATSTAALSTAACMNAKTVAYLHTLNGQPSPRHAWRRPDLSDEEDSPVKSELQRKAAANIKVMMSKKGTVTTCRTDEAAFDSFISSPRLHTTPTARSGFNKSVLVTGNLPNSFGDGANKPTHIAATKTAWSSSSSREVPITNSRKTATVTTILVPGTLCAARDMTQSQNHSKCGALSPRSRKAARENFKRPVHWFRFSRDVRVSGVPLKYGLDLLRKQREQNTLNWLVKPVDKTKKAKTRKTPTPSFQPATEEDIKDPIQRAGRRLLSKAAIPIQCSARKYLARREASSRMHATIALQSFFRRWKCEAFLRAYKHACTKAQAACRSWLVQEDVAYQNYQATQIQKIVRGYIAVAYVYDAIYWVSRLQAAMRGKLSRVRYAQLLDRRQYHALQLQAWYRGSITRREATKRTEAIRSIQTYYRTYVARITYQVAVVNIVIVQSAARRFLATKEVERRHLALMNSSVCKIQAAWRGFQGYTDYIFALVDILVLQRSMRKRMAKRKVNEMRKERAAIKIQSQWRRQQALIGMLYDLVHIIIAQVSPAFPCSSEEQLIGSMYFISSTCSL